jgi:hypothetical protein
MAMNKPLFTLFLLTSQPASIVNDLVDKKIRELAENLKNFGETEEKDKKSTCKTC